MSFSKHFTHLALVIGFALLMTAAESQAAQRWTSLIGNKTVEADFIGMWGDRVILEMSGGRRVTVKVDDLVAESRIQARRMAVEQENRRVETLQQIQLSAKEAAAPAPTPLPQPPSAPDYRRPSTGPPLVQLEWLEQQQRNGHFLLAQFDRMPASYQSDLERLARKAVGKLDSRTTEQLIKVAHSIGDLIVTRQRWIFSHPRFKSAQPESIDILKGVTLSAAGALRSGLNPDELKLEQLTSRPLRAWLVDVDARVAPHLYVLMEQLELAGVAQSSFEVQQEKDGVATVKRMTGDIETTESYTQIEGMWIPSDGAQDKWTTFVTESDTKLDAMPDGSLLADGQVQTGLVLAQGFINAPMSATSAREFHLQMDGLFALAAPQLAQMANVRPNNQMGMGGYDDMNMGGMDMGDDYDQMMDEGMMDEGMGDYPGGGASGTGGPGEF